MKTYWKKFLKVLYPLIPISSIRRHCLILCGYDIGTDVNIPRSFSISDLKTRRNNLIIGDRVAIGPNVLIITDSSANNSRLNQLFPLVSKNVIIKDDVWIGARVTILPGVTIGKCTIIGAGATVTKSIPDYSIAVGIPARVIKNINPDEVSIQ